MGPLTLLAMLVPASAGAAAAYRRLTGRGDVPGPAAAATPESLRQTLKGQLHGEKVIVVANREPYIHEKADDGTVRIRHPASGLVTALEPVLEACSGTWIAHGSGSADRESVDGKDHVPCPPGGNAYQLRRVWMSEEEERGFYFGFANEGLWPLCHLAHQRPAFRSEDWRAYRTVNQRFADAACEEADGPTPVVLVQDYHFALVPQLIRQRLPGATILTFWHIPWPNAEQLAICPFKNEILAGLLHSDILGFHTQLHCNNFVDAVDRSLEARIDRERQGVVLGGRTTLIRPYPISIEWPSRFSRSAPSAEKCRASVIEELHLPAGSQLGLGIDRLDYTKGIEERLLAVEQLFERHPRFRGRFTFVQLADPSRTAITRYKQLALDVEQLTARINDRFGEEAYRPIVLRRMHHEPADVFRYYRAADVCYVSSLHDGMNLVAKEFVAARDDLRGVLVLSSFTGASRELTEALIVNPYDLEQASDALAAALDLPEREQRDRLVAMRTCLAEFNVYRWAERMIVDGARTRHHGHLRERLTQVEHADGI
jgi:trehalose 6-phosphate synthase